MRRRERGMSVVSIHSLYHPSWATAERSRLEGLYRRTNPGGYKNGRMEWLGKRERRKKKLVNENGQATRETRKGHALFWFVRGEWFVCFFFFFFRVFSFFLFRSVVVWKCLSPTTSPSSSLFRGSARRKHMSHLLRDTSRTGFFYFFFFCQVWH